MNFFSHFVRLLALVISTIVQIAIEIGHHLNAAWKTRATPKHQATASASSPIPPAGVLASSQVRCHEPPVDVSVPRAVPPASAPTQPARPIEQPQIVDSDEHEPDELDWAGSLSHAGVAAMHFDNVLSMANAGWITPTPEHQADVTAALAAIEAFHERTCAAIAPILDQMTDDQHAEFFGDAGPDFPPTLPIGES